jgi:cytidyltransferase-like protein
MQKIVLVTGGFDPIHSGHIEYLKSAKTLGDTLIVGINSDNWLRRKKGQEFMSWEERATVVSNLRDVDRVINFDDADNSAINAIEKVRAIYPYHEIIFANGGDRTNENIPEMSVVDDNLTFVFGVGGTDKKNSSSWILQEWRAPKTTRSWGYYCVLHTVGKRTKLKELTVNPKTCLSMQRHDKRAEFWFIAEGEAAVYSLDSSSDHDLIGHYKLHEYIFIARNQWHMLCNETDQPLKLIEIQYGDDCIEEDIERK